MSNVKTNAMRLLDTAGISYKTHVYEDHDGLIDGISVAGKIGRPLEQVYKTLVTQGTSKNHHVFIIPVDRELDLKAAAKAASEKSVEMIKVADIIKVTGYIRGGCSPLGMKKQYKTIVDSSAEGLDTIIVSAGKIGSQIELSLKDLLAMTQGTSAEVTHRKEK